uniref:Uncharacterized protein n=1 Tax=Physcomitrium patens TaxID=3218 RepID=A0A2K1JL19_PHYPA|nr:hypothetical protein PHYPA_017079 [Physcomitrium patens]
MYPHTHTHREQNRKIERPKPKREDLQQKARRHSTLLFAPIRYPHHVATGSGSTRCSELCGVSTWTSSSRRSHSRRLRR